LGYSDVTAIAGNEAIQSIVNITSMPKSVTAGVFGTLKPGGNFFSAPMDALANTVTREDTQRYNSEIGNIGKFYARLLSGGLSVNKADVDAFTDQYKIKEGDKELTKLTKLAQMRQTFERAAEVKLISKNTPPEQIPLWENGIKAIMEAIPLTVAEVNKISNQRSKTKTIGEALKEAKGQVSPAYKGAGTAADPIKLD
jgi:hypothetical protein